MAGILKTYSISSQVESGTVDPGKLHAEVAASGAVFGFGGITATGDIISILGDSMNDESALDAIVAAHEEVSLHELKSKKNAAIDARTQALIAEGFIFDGRTFSLSLRAQMNWSGLFTMRELFSWPISVTTNDDQAYSLALENLVPFVATGSSKVAAAIGSGRALKLQVNAATTKGQVDAVEDDR